MIVSFASISISIPSLSQIPIPFHSVTFLFLYVLISYFSLLGCADIPSAPL